MVKLCVSPVLRVMVNRKDADIVFAPANLHGGEALFKGSRRLQPARKPWIWTKNRHSMIIAVDVLFAAK